MTALSQPIPTRTRVRGLRYRLICEQHGLNVEVGTRDQAIAQLGEHRREAQCLPWAPYAEVVPR
jgi:hypothetical protein